jgi:hypothetical protein
MKIVSFIEDQTVVRKILKHLDIWDTPPRPPPQKIVPLAPTELAMEDPFPWAADPLFSKDDSDPIYPDCVLSSRLLRRGPCRESLQPGGNFFGRPGAILGEGLSCHT